MEQSDRSLRLDKMMYLNDTALENGLAQIRVSLSFSLGYKKNSLT